jgi:hypothetical protein
MATQALAGAGESYVSMEASISLFSAHLIRSAVPHYDIVTTLQPCREFQIKNNGYRSCIIRCVGKDALVTHMTGEAYVCSFPVDVKMIIISCP